MDGIPQEGNVAVEDDSVVRVSASTNPAQLAQALAHACYEQQRPKLRAIGAGAVNQAMKSLAICSGYLAPRGMSLLIRPGFESVVIDGKEVSSMTFRMCIED